MRALSWLRAALAYGLDRVHVDAVDLSEPSLVQVTSAGVSGDLAFVGSSPYGVDPAASFIDLPATPTDFRNRVLVRVAGWSIPEGKAARLRQVGLFAEIAQRTIGVGPGSTIRRLPVTSPTGPFLDGNIAWAITAPRTANQRRLDLASSLPRGWTTDVSGTTPAVITRDPELPYRTPVVGFPGSPVGHFGVLRDMRATWQRPLDCDVTVEGGHDVVLWASVKQSNPDTRPDLALSLPDGYDLGALTPEDRFLVSNPRAIYSRVGGFLLLEVGPSNRNASYLPTSPGRRA